MISFRRACPKDWLGGRLSLLLLLSFGSPAIGSTPCRLYLAQTQLMGMLLSFASSRLRHCEERSSLIRVYTFDKKQIALSSCLLRAMTHVVVLLCGSGCPTEHPEQRDKLYSAGNITLTSLRGTKQSNTCLYF
jgi:hypothetical protein